MHIVRAGGTFSKKQERYFFLKGTLFFSAGVILIILAIFIFIYSSEVAGLISFVTGLLSIGNGILYFFKSKNWTKGMIGEKKVVEALMPLDNSYVLINDVVLPYRKGNIDHVLVGPNGIFALETKSYSLTYFKRKAVKQTIRNSIALKD